MPPPKLSSGLAPSITLDKSGKQVRHWRTALREIKGIGGGRWFARTWVGHKESPFAASAVASKGTLLDAVSVPSASASPEKPSGLSKLAAVALSSPAPQAIAEGISNILSSTSIPTPPIKTDATPALSQTRFLADDPMDS